MPVNLCRLQTITKLTLALYFLSLKLHHINADLQLIMLYSLPNSPIHNAYTAKSQLNDYQLEPYNNAIFNATDLAFVVMLKDQLNQQVHPYRLLEHPFYQQWNEGALTQDDLTGHA